MSYLSKQDLYTHLYPEVIDEITRNNVKVYANLAAFPPTGIQRYYYQATDTSKYYTWDGDTYNETAYVDIVDKAITTAIGEAKGFLTRFDLIKMFSEDDDLRTFQDDMLDNKVKDLAQWHIVRLCNVQVNFEVAKASYDDAMKFFEKIQKGIIDPDGWPLKTLDPKTMQSDDGLVQWSVMHKRKNNY